ncbi:MAG: hypothetical protein ACREP3_05425 [Candidatus Binatia bacterium]
MARERLKLLHQIFVMRYLRAMIEPTRWLYDPKNKEEALAIHMKVLKSAA